MIISKTPLRVSFFSGGSDLPSFYNKENGAALSVTINKYIYVMVHKTPHLGVRVMYDQIEEFPDVEAMQSNITSETLKYFNIEKEITVASISDVLSRGSGLGSSSAFTVGLINALASGKWGVASNGYLADIACEIEMNRCKYPVGKQDQYAAAYGGLNLFHFRKNGEVAVENTVIDIDTFAKLESNLLLVYSGKGRSANSILQKQSAAMSDVDKFNLVKRSRDKAFTGLEYLKKKDVDSFGDLLHEAWVDKKSIVKEISQDYFDVVYQNIRTAGAIGGKLLGAGGGGFFLFYVQPDKRKQVIDYIENNTECKVYDFKFTDRGSQIVSMC